MASHQYSFEEIRVLLETTLEDVNSVLFNSSQQHNQYYYQNFSGLSLRSLKYMNIYLNRTNTSHLFGGIIDSLISKFSQSLTEYKSRNIFIDSLKQRQDDQQRQQDEIYHFMNTRNTLMPLECLSDYQNQKQRKELEDFVQSMKKHTQTPKESKRSLILPKENKFQLKMGRKATFDPAALPIEEISAIKRTYSAIPQQEIGRKDIQIQTEAIVNQNEIVNIKKQEIEIASQCDSYSVSVSQCVEDSFSQTKQKAPPIQKKKKKTSNEPQIKNKKKAKFNNGNLTSIKQDLNSMQKKTSKIDQLNPSSINVISASCLKLCSRQLHLAVANFSEEPTITVSFSNQHKNDMLVSSKNIISFHQMQSDSRLQQKLKDTQNQVGDDIEIIQKEPIDAMEQLKQRIRLKYEEPKGNAMQPIHEMTNSFISFNSSFKQNTDHVQQSEETQIYNQSIFGQKVHKKTSLLFQSQTMKLPISSVKILESSQNKHFLHLRQKSQFSNQAKSLPKAEKPSPIKKDSIIKRQVKISHPRAFYIEEKIAQAVANFDKNNIVKPQEKIRKQRKSSDDQLMPSSRGKLQSQSISSAPSQDYLLPRQIHTDFKPLKAELKLKKSKLTILRKSQILQGQMGEESSGNISTQKILNISKQKHFRPQSYDTNIENGGLFVITNKNRLTSEAISRKSRDNSYNVHLGGKRSPKKIKLPKDQQQLEQQDKVKESQSAKTSKNASISQKSPYSTVSRSSLLLSEKISPKKPSPKEEGKCIQSDYRKSLNQSSCENIIAKKGISSLQSQIRSHSNSKSSVYYNAHSSPFEGEKQLPFQICQLRSKLRNRAYKNKLALYLQLIQTTHKKFCGEGCIHVKQLLQGSNGDIAQNILRLFKKLK